MDPFPPPAPAELAPPAVPVGTAPVDETTAVDGIVDEIVPVVHRPGELTAGWATLTTLVWIGVAVGFAAVWNTSRQLGLATWWLGPVAQPRSIVVNLVPFVVPALMIAASLTRRRHLPWFGLLGAGVTAAIGVADLSRVRGLGVVELALAGAAAAMSAASFTGMYRADRR